MPTQKPKKKYRTLKEPATHGRFDSDKIRQVIRSLLAESTEEEMTTSIPGRVAGEEVKRVVYKKKEEDKPRRKGDSKSKRSPITDALADLAAAGKVRLPTKKGKLKDFEVVRIKGESISETVIKDRKYQPQTPVKQATRRTQSWTLKVRRGLFVPLPKEVQVKYDVQAGDNIDLIPTDDGLRLIFTKNRPRAYKKLWTLAAKLFESEDDATFWLHEPQYGLSEERPIDRMRTINGAKEVEDLLYQIGHGIVA